MAGFSLRLDLAIEANRNFLENEFGDLSFFVVLNRVIHFAVLSAEQETIVENVNLASNRDFKHYPASAKKNKGVACRCLRFAADCRQNVLFLVKLNPEFLIILIILIIVSFRKDS